MKNYYKAKEFVLNQLKERGKDASYEISNHVIYTAYYAVKHQLSDEEFKEYLNSITEKTNKKLYNCGYQCYLTSPLGKDIRGFTSGGYWVDDAKKSFKLAVINYYNDLVEYNKSEEDELSDGKE